MLTETIVVTGGAGFIGSNFVNAWVGHKLGKVINLDKLTYAGNMENLAGISQNPAHIFVHADIGDRAAVKSLLETHRPRAVLNFAAESHVDRSIHGPDAFIQTNVVGTFNLLEEVRAYWQALPVDEQQQFRFLHVLPTKCTARWGRMIQHLKKPMPTSPIARIQPQKRPLIIWSVPITTPMVCPR